MINDKRIMVTGASGFVGSAVCTELISLHYKVRCAVRSVSVDYSLNSEIVEVPEIGPDTDWTYALHGVGLVIHLAARVHITRDVAQEPLTAFRYVNVNGTLNLAHQAALAGVKRFVFISSIGVNGSHTGMGNAFSEEDQPQPHNAYALSKWEAEQGLMRISAETGLEVVIIRPPLVYGFNAPGNFGTLMRAVWHGMPLPLGAIQNQRSLVALDNLVDFIITCLTHPDASNQTFLVSDGEDISTTELLKCTASAMGVKARLIPVPATIIQVGAWLLGKSDTAQSLCGNLQVDISKVRQLLGWAAPISVKEGLQRAVKNYKGNK